MSTEADALPSPATTAGPGVAERLAARVRGLRGGAGAGDLDRWLLVIGGLLMPLGVLFVVLGWIGAARTPLLVEQIPYLISGGLLGTCLVFLGGFVYFTYWQTVRVRDGRAQHIEVVQALGRIEALLVAGAPATGGRAASVADRARPGAVATPKGTLFHRPDCSIVAGRDNLRLVTAADAGLEPCRVCNPEPLR